MPGIERKIAEIGGFVHMPFLILGLCGLRFAGLRKILFLFTYCSRVRLYPGTVRRKPVLNARRPAAGGRSLTRVENQSQIVDRRVCREVFPYGDDRDNIRLTDDTH
jgi:hypothetical protein